MKLINTVFPLALLLSTNVLAADNLMNRMQGDLGLFANVSSSPIRGIGNNSTVLPYAYFDYGRIFTRIDTFGVKTLPLGYGHLELVGRIKFDGYQTAGIAELQGINDRQNPAPIGVGTFQLTPLGAFFLYAFYDANRSHGNIYEAVYAAKFPLGKMTVYPQIGIEHYSSDYTSYYYGVSAAESVASGYASYIPTASTNRSFRIMFEVPISQGWFANFYLQRKWLGAAITGSPLVNTQFANNGFITVAYRFK